MSVVEDIADGLRVWVTRDQRAFTEEQIMERARNIAAALLGNYIIVDRNEPVHFVDQCKGSDPRAIRVERRADESLRLTVLTPVSDIDLTEEDQLVAGLLVEPTP